MSCCCGPQPAPEVSLPVRESTCGGSKPEKPANGSEWAILGVLILLSGLSMNLSLAVNLSSMDGTTRWLVHGGLAAAGVLAVALGASDLFRPAWTALHERRIVTEHLFLAGICAAWGVSLHTTLTGQAAVFYEVPILLPAIRRFGSILLGRQRRSIEVAAQELLAGVATVRMRRGQDWQAVPLLDVRSGDEILVKPGEAVPADAIITEGQAFVQTRSLTGEPFPLPLKSGDSVSSGMVPLDGELELRVVSLPSDSELSRITDATRDLLERPPAFLRSVESVLRWFFPAVLKTSLAVLAFWAWHSGWQAAIANSLAVVLVACPCAFGMALPLLFRRGLAGCLQRGIEPVDAAFMESLSLVRVVAFDKTGTLTVPELSVATLTCAPSVDSALVRSVLAALHSRSDHPVARPFWHWAAEAGEIQVRDLLVIPGRGLQAGILLDGKWVAVRLGHAKFMSRPPGQWAASESSPQRRLFIEIGGGLAGVCLLTEELRPSAAGACHQLAAAGLHVVLLTGDATVPPELARAFQEVHTSQRPADKAARVRQWEQAGQPVLFIGDGINDATALATASASIALGDSAPLASASAQARWRHSDLATLPSVLAEARSMAARAKLILRVALTYNTAGMALASAGLLHPVAASIIMLLSSGTVMALAARSNPLRFSSLISLKRLEGALVSLAS